MSTHGREEPMADSEWRMNGCLALGRTFTRVARLGRSERKTEAYKYAVRWDLERYENDPGGSVQCPVTCCSAW